MKPLRVYDRKVTEDLFELNQESKSRGHTLKIKKQRSRLNVRKHFFTNRIVDLWNNLTEEIISAKNLITFKNRLDKYWANQPMKYDFDAEYEFITRSESSNIQYEEEQNILVQQQRSEDHRIHRYIDFHSNEPYIPYTVQILFGPRCHPVSDGSIHCMTSNDLDTFMCSLYFGFIWHSIIT